MSPSSSDDDDDGDDHDHKDPDEEGDAKGDIIDFLQDQEFNRVRKEMKTINTKHRRLYELVKALEANRMQLMDAILPQIDKRIAGLIAQHSETDATVRAMDANMATATALANVVRSVELSLIHI